MCRLDEKISLIQITKTLFYEPSYNNCWAEMNMKTIEKLAVATVILYFLAQIVGRASSYLIILAPHKSEWFGVLSALPVVVVLLAVNIAIAIWLYRTAKQEKRAPWVWAMFGFVFGVSGAILYFVFRIYEMMKQKEVSEQNDGQISSESALSDEL
jgi:uncharacterized BrkB/YihY/UPF0761 family membrane protein